MYQDMLQKTNLLKNGACDAICHISNRFIICFLSELFLPAVCYVSFQWSYTHSITKWEVPSGKFLGGAPQLYSFANRVEIIDAKSVEGMKFKPQLHGTHRIIHHFL